MIVACGGAVVATDPGSTGEDAPSSQRPRLVKCVAEHSPDAGYVTLDIWRSCLPNDAPPSWSPSAKPDERELCSCVPGEKHSLCLRYAD